MARRRVRWLSGAAVIGVPSPFAYGSLSAVARICRRRLDVEILGKAESAEVNTNAASSSPSCRSCRLETRSTMPNSQMRGLDQIGSTILGSQFIARSVGPCSAYGGQGVSRLG